MISTWWQGLEPRERLLIGIAGLLSLITVAVFGVIQPISAAKAEARVSLERANQDKDLVERSLQRLRSASANRLGPAADNDEFRTWVTSSARAEGLSIARLQNGSDGTLELLFSDVDPTRLYAWLDEVSGVAGGHVVNANLTGREDVVQAIIELQGTSQ